MKISLELNDEFQSMKSSYETLRQQLSLHQEARKSVLHPCQNGVDIQVIMRVQDPSDDSTIWCLVK